MKSFFNFRDSLSEAKIGDKVEITHGSQKGLVGHVGEIRKGLGGTNHTYTVDYDDNGKRASVQVKKAHTKVVRESLSNINENRSLHTKVILDRTKHIYSEPIDGQLTGGNLSHSLETKSPTFAKLMSKHYGDIHHIVKHASDAELKQIHHDFTKTNEEVRVNEVRSEYSKAAHDEDGQALGIRPGSKEEPNPIVKHEVTQSGGKHYISVVHKSGMSYSHKGADGNTQNFDSKEAAEKKAAELNKKHNV